MNEPLEDVTKHECASKFDWKLLYFTIYCITLKGVDKASYHGGQEVRAYLNKVNQGLEEKDWKVTCLLFATNAPDQNPVEDVWLQGKNFLRRHFYENKTFNQVKWSFLNFLNRKVFNFGKCRWYLEIPQPV